MVAAGSLEGRQFIWAMDDRMRSPKNAPGAVVQFISKKSHSGERMTNINRRGIGLAACAVVGAAVGTSLAVSAPAGAQPQVADNVWIQCTEFSGPNTQWPHPLTGCSSRSGSGGGQTFRVAPGTEEIQFSKPFEGGKTLQLTNITNTVVGPSPDCPEDHPVKANVAGVIGPKGPYAGSPVSATICADATDFILQPKTLFVISRVPGSPGDVNPGA
jgi:hypothetical protein